MLPKDVEESMISVLSAWGFEDYAWIFTSLGCIDYLAVIATLCNHSAKVINYDFYEDKEILVGYLAAHHDKVWAEDGIVYVDSPFGQFSYHVFNGEDEVADSRGYEPFLREWDGIPKQRVSYFFVREIIADIALDGMEARRFAQWPEQEVYDSERMDYELMEWVPCKEGELGGTYADYIEVKTAIAELEDELEYAD